MKDAMCAWPELVLADSTYKMIENGFVVFILAVMDSGFNTHIVGVGLLANEHKAQFRV